VSRGDSPRCERGRQPTVRDALANTDISVSRDVPREEVSGVPLKIRNKTDPGSIPASLMNSIKCRAAARVSITLLLGRNVSPYPVLTSRAFEAGGS
jgi:hypothetical protein